jgi:hypothetical protein
VLDARESGRDTSPDALCGRVVCDEVRVLRLEAFEFLDECVELGVGYFGVVEDVITFFVAADETAELVDAVSRRHRSRAST